jgi:enoyl-[acyl-carrier protein] reductase/trans-2-enoyl-CoA reductase (NAD+)
LAIIHPKVRGFICTTTHPKGCELNVRDQIEATRKLGVREDGPKKVLVIGASSGYGLAARITAAFGFKADTLGVFFEKPGTETKAGTAGWYNAAAFDKFAKAEGLYSKSINGDAFSDEARAKVIELIKNEMGGKVDLVIYSLASPVRKLPQTGEVIRSALKPIGQPYKSTAIDTNKDTIIEASIEPATEQEIADTVTVMGGQDWQLWIDALAGANVLAEGARTVAFSYIGSDITWPIYWHGALGQAKQDLDETALRLDQKLADEVKGGANVAVLKSVVTQASSAIPVMPLYLSMVFKIMQEKAFTKVPRTSSTACTATVCTVPTVRRPTWTRRAACAWTTGNCATTCRTPARPVATGDHREPVRADRLRRLQEAVPQPVRFRAR